MNNTKKILNHVLSKITLSKEEKENLQKHAKNIISLLEKQGLQAQVGGSLAKNTMIKTSTKPDIDIFITFDYSEDILKLEKKLQNIKEIKNLKKVHGSRDYYQIEEKKALIELIPVVKNKDPATAENVTDVSLQHVKYVKQHLRKKPELQKEILLAKAFFKAQKIYGAESYIKGFSGYSLEVLTIHFGSFIKMLKGLMKHKVIDPQKHYRRETEIKRELNESKIQGPIILIDPTYQYRNISAGLGRETYEKFLQISKEFLKNPDEKYFNKKEIDLHALKKRVQKRQKAIIITIKTKRQEGDIAGSKMRKFFDFFTKELQRKNQKIIEKHYEYQGHGQEATGYLRIQENNERIITGPNKGLEEASKKFKRQRKNTYLKGKQWCAKEKTSIQKIYNQTKKFEKEMDVQTEIKKL